MAARSAQAKEARKAELFTQLRQVHDLLTAYQDKHNATKYGCQRSGHCCNVGLQLHMMECEHVAANLRETIGDDKKRLNAVIKSLERSFTDPDWNWASAIGEQWCSFYDDGCTIYPYRPSICRMYGVVLQVDDFCPREKLANGESYVYVQPDVDRMIALYYRTLDNYGRLYPKLDYTVYMPRGVLEFLAPERIPKLRASTDKKFWKRERGYRTQYQASYRIKPSLVTNVKFPFAIPAR